MEAKRADRVARAAARSAGGNDPAKASIAEAIIALARGSAAGALTHDLYFEQTTELVTASGDKKILKEWIRR
jgi:hypothetical protein